jgi:hypothetical protein
VNRLTLKIPYWRKLQYLWVKAFKITVLIPALIVNLIMEIPLTMMFGKNFVEKNPVLDWITTIFSLYILFGIGYRMAKWIDKQKRRYLLTMALIVSFVVVYMFSDYISKKFPSQEDLGSTVGIPMVFILTAFVFLIILQIIKLRWHHITNLYSDTPSQKTNSTVKKQEKVKGNENIYVIVARRAIALSALIIGIAISGFHWENLFTYLIFYWIFVSILGMIKVEVIE